MRMKPYNYDKNYKINKKGNYTNNFFDYISMEKDLQRTPRIGQGEWPLASHQGMGS